MNKFVLSVLGCDRPGIVAEVSEILTVHECNIEDLTQTVLQSEFAAIFIFTLGHGRTSGELQASLQSRLEPQGLNVRLKKMQAGCPAIQNSDPFVAVAIGPDRTGQISALSGVMRDFGCNITTIRAINRSDLYPDKIVIIIEMDVPATAAVSDLRQRLEEASSSLGLACSLQHKDIFESIHRI
ncbi:glycine cleavage system protein R [Desulfonatronovibrio hydrogenovorans]|uniref:glycine cleavage system protein R n=1 Tax=Desulfonatronovibrio hydrogenovorans TaxID=53245 RepID=UPI000490DC2F|nr:ACT domain-containing protein [Desulfonatronovibrio hydrogenovorans]